MNETSLDTYPKCLDMGENISNSMKLAILINYMKTINGDPMLLRINCSSRNVQGKLLKKNDTEIAEVIKNCDGKIDCSNIQGRHSFNKSICMYCYHGLNFNRNQKLEKRIISLILHLIIEHNWKSFDSLDLKKEMFNYHIYLKYSKILYPINRTIFNILNLIANDEHSNIPSIDVLISSCKNMDVPDTDILANTIKELYNFNDLNKKEVTDITVELTKAVNKLNKYVEQMKIENNLIDEYKDEENNINYIQISNNNKHEGENNNINNENDEIVVEKLDKNTKPNSKEVKNNIDTEKIGEKNNIESTQRSNIVEDEYANNNINNNISVSKNIIDNKPFNPFDPNNIVEIINMQNENIKTNDNINSKDIKKKTNNVAKYTNTFYENVEKDLNLNESKTTLYSKNKSTVYEKLGEIIIINDVGIKPTIENKKQVDIKNILFDNLLNNTRPIDKSSKSYKEEQTFKYLKFIINLNKELINDKEEARKFVINKSKEEKGLKKEMKEEFEKLYNEAINRTTGLGEFYGIGNVYKQTDTQNNELYHKLLYCLSKNSIGDTENFFMGNAGLKDMERPLEYLLSNGHMFCEKDKYKIFKNGSKKGELNPNSIDTNKSNYYIFESPLMMMQSSKEYAVEYIEDEDRIYLYDFYTDGSNKRESRYFIKLGDKKIDETVQKLLSDRRHTVYTTNVKKLQERFYACDTRFWNVFDLELATTLLDEYEKATEDIEIRNFCESKDIYYHTAENKIYNMPIYREYALHLKDKMIKNQDGSLLGPYYIEEFIECNISNSKKWLDTQLKIKPQYNYNDKYILRKFSIENNLNMDLYLNIIPDEYSVIECYVENIDEIFEEIILNGKRDISPLFQNIKKYDDIEIQKELLKTELYKLTYFILLKSSFWFRGLRVLNLDDKRIVIMFPTSQRDGIFNVIHRALREVSKRFIKNRTIKKPHIVINIKDNGDIIY